jgi:hypothetical protein
MKRFLGFVLVAPLLLASFAWGCAALWFDGPLSGLLAAGFAATSIALLGWVRPIRKGLAGYAGLLLIAILWWLSIEPSNERDWLPDVARTTTAVIDGDRVAIRNIRNFDYRTETDYDERWEDRTYDLSKLRGVDLFLIYWGSPWIAHTIMSWEFADGPPLAISIETRKEKGEAYSAVLGFFRQFELYYVVSDERDVVRLRSNYRGEDVYLYRLLAPAETARALLLDYLEEINRLAVEPRWYNAFTHNCTTTIRRHAQNIAPGNPFNWRILLNGRLDELGYQRGTIDTSLPFDELKARSNIGERANAANAMSDFSARIREDLPGQRSPAPPSTARRANRSAP